MDAYEYIQIFSKFDYFMYFWWIGLIPGSGPVPVFGVDRLDHRFGSGNFDLNTTSMTKR